MTGGAGPARFSASAFGEFLVAPDAAEHLSPVAGPGTLVLDLTDGPSALDGLDRERIASILPTLPCVTIALTPERLATDPADGRRGSGQELANLCDVRVEREEELAPLIDGYAKAPLAALAFVQLLRSAGGKSIYAGLVAESFVYSTLQAGPEFGAWRSATKAKRDPAASATGPACRVERDRGRLEIFFSRPEKHNAFSRELRDRLCEALQLAVADPSIDEVVVRGEGPSFCSGGDLDEFGTFPNPAEAHAIRTTRSPALLLSRLADRVHFEVHGACIGAGAELPAFTDHVVADQDAFFALPEVALGLIPGAGGTVSLPRRIGRQRTAWLGLSGARIDAQTALDWGLIDEVRLG